MQEEGPEPIRGAEASALLDAGGEWRRRATGSIPRPAKPRRAAGTSGTDTRQRAGAPGGGPPMRPKRRPMCRMCRMELHGEKVVLRPTEDAETETLDRIVREPEVAAWWSPPDNYASTFTVFLDEEVIGAVQFTEESAPDHRHAGIDIFLTARHTGVGLGTDSVRTLARWLLDDRGHHRLTIDPATENASAIASYRKVGFQPVGVLRRYWRDHRTGEWRDGLLMDLLADELR